MLLDTNLCPRSPLPWTEFTTAVGNILLHPLPWPTQLALLLLFFLFLAGVFWTIPRLYRSPRSGKRRWRRQWTRTVLVLTAALLLLTSPSTVALATQVLLESVPADSGETVDAIVVLGRGEWARRDRTATALELWQAKRAPRIFASGWSDTPHLIAAWQARGIPDQALGGENCSRTTEENAQFTALALKPQGVQRILLVTDAPHMLRARFTFESFGFQVISHSTRMPPPKTYRQRAAVLLREYGGLIGYGLQGRFFGRSTH